MSGEDLLTALVSVAVSVFVARPFFVRGRKGKNKSRTKES